MDDNTKVIISSMFIFALLLKIISIIFKTKKLSDQQEYKIVIMGSLVFMYTSWLVIYMANVKPFIQPIIKNSY